MVVLYPHLKNITTHTQQTQICFPLSHCSSVLLSHTVALSATCSVSIFFCSRWGLKYLSYLSACLTSQVYSSLWVAPIALPAPDVLWLSYREDTTLFSVTLICTPTSVLFTVQRANTRGLKLFGTFVFCP